MSAGGGRVRGCPRAGEECVDIPEEPLGTRVVPHPGPAVDVDEPGAAALMTAWEPRDGCPGGARAETTAGSLVLKTKGCVLSYLLLSSSPCI